MKYKVLYRKYRPNDFENIIGQDYIIKTLKNSIIHNNISHAYIFSGPRGTGKTTTAKVFSKAINCLEPIDGSPCGKCAFCTNFQENPDIIEIDAASNNGVDEIRGLIENIKLAPTNGKYKVYIIDEVHMLSTSAFNALLLTLEEPPAHTIFILATTNIESVPITILSRCQRFDFQKIKIVDIVARLKEICKIENIAIDEEALKEIAYLAEGGMRDALSLLDQLSKSEEKITLDLIEKQIKTISQKGINDLLQTIEDNDINRCLELINEYRNRAVDYKSLVKKIIDIISEKAKNFKRNGQDSRLQFIDYKNLIFSLADSLNKININVDSYTILEMILLEYFNEDASKLKINKENTKVIAEETQNEEINIEVKPENHIDEDVSNDNLEKFIEIRINNCFVEAKKSHLENAKKEFNDYILTSNNGKIKSTLEDSDVVAASSKYVILTTSNKHNVDSSNKMSLEIEKSLKKAIGKEYKIVFIDDDRWKDEKEKYILNLKNKKIYEYIEEDSNLLETKTVLNDVFDKDKIEIV